MIKYNLKELIEKDQIIPIKKDVINSKRFKKLSTTAQSIYIDILSQFNYKKNNNGYLSISVDTRRNIKHTNFHNAIQELKANKFIKSGIRVGFFYLTCYL